MLQLTQSVGCIRRTRSISPLRICLGSRRVIIRLQ